MDNEVEKLKRELAEIQQENKTLKQLSSEQAEKLVILKGVQRDYNDLLKQQQAATIQIRHSAAFWQNVEANLKNDTDYIKTLIKNGSITMNDADQNGYTLLHCAAFWGNYEITQLCINLGADLKYINKHGNNALDTARRANAHDTEQLLLFNEMKANIGDRIRNLSNNINKQNGIVANIVSQLSLIGDQSKQLFSKILNELMINIIQNKSIFSDDLLTLCWRFEEMKGDPLKSELWNTIRKTCQEIIHNTSKKDWFWLKQCIIPSNIWYSEISDTEEVEKKEEIQDIDDHKSYLYYQLLSMIKIESKKQLNTLQNNLNSDALKDKTAWNKLIHWDVSPHKLTELQGGYNESVLMPRQDNIPNGVIAEYTEYQLNHNATNDLFDGSKFYDHYQYLSKLSLLAQIVDDEFQNSVQRIFNVDKHSNIGIINNNNINILYQRGPVKLLKRALSKTENDYYNENYPKSSCVLDLNRCSLIFNDIGSLLFALDLFINKVRAYESGSIIGIVRCKNGFKDYIKEVQYADIKVNVLIRGNTNNIIGEIQFLLKTVVNFKSSAHNVYAIERDEEFIRNSVSSILPSLLNKEKQLKIYAAMGDINGLCKFMINNNKSEKDIMKIDKDGKISILTPICERGKEDAFKFIISLMNKEELMNDLFSDGKKSQTPIECAIRNNHKCLIEVIFKINEVKNRYRESDKWKYRLIYRLFKNCNNTNTIDYIMKEMELRNKEIVELMKYKYPTEGVSYYEDKIIVETIRKNKLNVLLKLSSILGEESFTERLFDVDIKNRNGFEIAVVVNKFDTIKYLLSIKGIREKCINEMKIKWRIVYHLNARNCKRITEYVINELKLNDEKKLKEIQSYKYPKPNDMNGFVSSAYDYWNKEISNDAINNILAVQKQ